MRSSVRADLPFDTLDTRPARYSLRFLAFHRYPRFLRARSFIINHRAHIVCERACPFGLRISSSADRCCRWKVIASVPFTRRGLDRFHLTLHGTTVTSHRRRVFASYVEARRVNEPHQSARRRPASYRVDRASRRLHPREAGIFARRGTCRDGVRACCIRRRRVCPARFFRFFSHGSSLIDCCAQTRSSRTSSVTRRARARGDNYDNDVYTNIIRTYIHTYVRSVGSPQRGSRGRLGSSPDTHERIDRPSRTGERRPVVNNVRYRLGATPLRKPYETVRPAAFDIRERRAVNFGERKKEKRGQEKRGRERETDERRERVLRSLDRSGYASLSMCVTQREIMIG